MTALSVATAVAVYLCLLPSVHGRFEEIVQDNGRCTKPVNCTEKYDSEACCDKAQCCRLKTQDDPLSYCYYCPDISFCCPVETCCHKAGNTSMLIVGIGSAILLLIVAFYSCFRYLMEAEYKPTQDPQRFELAALRAALTHSDYMICLGKK